MKFPRFPLPALVLSCSLHADTGPMTETERLALIDRLDELKARAENHLSKHLGSAASAFARATASNDAAVDLYLDSIKKVRYDEMGRKTSEFLDWKRTQKDLLRDRSFGTALRLQLRWIILTMKVANNEGVNREIAAEAMALLDELYQNPESLGRHLSILTQAANNTIFAQAFDLPPLQDKNWPGSPLSGGNGRYRVDPPFHLAIFPLLRKSGDVDQLAGAWDKRIRYEEIALGFWSSGSDGKGNSPARDEFIAEKLPQLEWDKHEDLYKVGDQRAAAVKMLELLQQNIGHHQACDWEARFRALIDPTPAK